MIKPVEQLGLDERRLAERSDRGVEVTLAVTGIANEVLDRRRPMQELTDTNIESSTPIISPLDVMKNLPQTETSKETVRTSRAAIEGIIEDPTKESKLIVVVGPCSIHDIGAVLEYAKQLGEIRRDYADDLEIVMRTYLEKPRTTTGWEGFIEDPYLDGSYDKNAGYLMSRELLNYITTEGLPVSTELLNTSTPQYLDDLISWGAVGARTVESQLHRKLSSGVSFPVGFKNGTGGGIKIAVDAIMSARNSHYMDGINLLNQPTRYKTTGNSFTHLILRGSGKGPNYDSEHVALAECSLIEAGINPAIMIDASHGNSDRDHRKQLPVTRAIAEQIAAGNSSIMGVMLESFLVAGKQELGDGKNLKYGQSVTDACIDMDETRRALDVLAESVQARRRT